MVHLQALRVYDSQRAERQFVEIRFGDRFDEHVVTEVFLLRVVEEVPVNCGFVREAASGKATSERRHWGIEYGFKRQINTVPGCMTAHERLVLCERRATKRDGQNETKYEDRSQDGEARMKSPAAGGLGATTCAIVFTCLHIHS